MHSQYNTVMLICRDYCLNNYILMNMEYFSNIET